MSNNVDLTDLEIADPIEIADAPAQSDDIKTFSQALPILARHSIVPVSIGNHLWRVGSLEYDKGGIVRLAREYQARMHETQRPSARPPLIDIEIADAPAALSGQMKTYAQGYIDARKRAGLAWLDMGRFLIEARREAKHGEWGLFLAATQTSEDQAKRLMAIYAQSQTDRAFADAVRTNVLSVATAYELTTAPADIQQRLLESDAPITRAQIREEKRAANPAPAPTLDVASPDLSDILLRLDAHGYAKTTTRQQGITTFYSFRDYSGHSDETGGELEMAEGQLPLWLAELDSSAAYAQAKQERYLDMQRRFAVLRYDLRRDGAQFKLIKPEGGMLASGPLDMHMKTLTKLEASAPPPLPDPDTQHMETIKAILMEAESKGERTGTHLYQQAYDHAREIHDVALYNKAIALIDQATDTPLEVAPTEPMRLPAVPVRPKRPVSADASAVIAYLKQIETYASALESVIQALQRRLPE